MANSKTGFWAFLGAVGLTGVVSTGVLFDANKVFLGKDDVAPIEAEQASEQAIETEKPAEMAALPTKAEEQPAATEQSTATEQPAAEQPAATAQPVAEQPAAIAAEPPRFDILRVEPDGSMVIAGSAAANSQIEVVAGTTVIARTTAGPNGDFVAVLDEPLKPGDYEVVLRSVLPEGASMASQETAIVSIPEAGGKDVLALVEAPGAPSRLITTPSAETLVPVAPEQSAENAEQPAAEAAPQVAMAEPEKPTEEAPAEEAATQGEVTMGGTVEVPAAETSATQTPSAEAPAAEAPAAEVPVAAATDVRIDAVEIDGKTVFVAGSAAPGTRLRIYANSILLGDTTASPGGKFLVEVNRELPVGDYVIRADALDTAGEVIMRAAVPFSRPEGEKVAAIAVMQPPMLPATPPIVSGEVATPLPEKVLVPDGAGEQAATDTADAQPDAASSQEQAALVPTEQSVIIRRGDTLWQISRRVYGRGIKYTTIYLANEDQIKNPDMIWPGQVFALPDEAASAGQ